MQKLGSLNQETAEDIFFGQAVIIWARWFLIAAATTLVMTSFDDQGTLIKGTLPIVGLMAMNFYLHGRYLMERPIQRPLLIATSVMDLLIVTLLVAFWPLQEGETRLDNQFFLFYYPLVLAFAFVMPRKIEALYTVAAIAIYSVVIVFSVDMLVQPANPEYSEAVALQVIIRTMLFRMIALGAVGGLAKLLLADSAGAPARRASRHELSPVRQRNAMKILPSLKRLMKAVLDPEVDPRATYAGAFEKHQKLIERVRTARLSLGRSRGGLAAKLAEANAGSPSGAANGPLEEQLRWIVDEGIAALEAELKELDQEERGLALLEERLAAEQRVVSAGRQTLAARRTAAEARSLVRAELSGVPRELKDFGAILAGVERKADDVEAKVSAAMSHLAAMVAFAATRAKASRRPATSPPVTPRPPEARPRGP